MNHKDPFELYYDILPKHSRTPGPSSVTILCKNLQKRSVLVGLTIWPSSQTLTLSAIFNVDRSGIPETSLGVETEWKMGKDEDETFKNTQWREFFQEKLTRTFFVDGL